jgi:glutaredoxin
MTKVREIVSGKNLYNIFLHLALVASLLVIAVLAKQNRDLKRGSGQAPKANMRAGEYFSLAGLTPASNGAQLDSTSSRQLIFVFTTRCPWCKETLPMWNSLADSTAQKKSLPVRGICLDSLEETRASIAQNKLTLPVIVPSNKELFSHFNKLNSVPLTIVRVGTGHAPTVWQGKLFDEEFRVVSGAIANTSDHQL